ncbi:hypothetical protein ASPACDRAFT_43996 [Aspergillus aculeatus ATCC 16872]|uniref:Uncharacterized protein n=1 Tax=Aspergillus aculeatus (strain ATCC 16872 / CBS 172.66 / WB 5094) TaxID=690307 RepID=A0A1L9WT62_ASPA1|nr:uncharacterized protein ASPACDRAFT_43996 [Aspergillus aculeatus ATCC 16872]OJJ99333.1 hypothetical protein ASPACDRAFT_43996 [Aspergillus aculeatus ATCC 16872]
MAIALVRVILGVDYGQNMDISWFYFWSSMEIGAAVMVACAASSRQLCVTSRNRHLFKQTSESIMHPLSRSTQAIADF